MEKSFKVTLLRSLIGCSQRQKDTIRCLGLRKIRQTVDVKDSPAHRGQIMKVQHLVEVEIKR